MDQLQKTLIKQLIRGMSDEDLLNKLRLEDKVENPPTFPDLLLLVRHEESRRTEHRLRHKKVVKSQMHVSLPKVSENVSTPKALVQPTVASKSAGSELEEQVTMIQQELQTLLKGHDNASRGPGRQGFCYRCGDDGHWTPTCKQKPNRHLVKEKLDARKLASDSGKSEN